VIATLAVLVALQAVGPVAVDATPAHATTVRELLAASWGISASDPVRSGELAAQALELARAEGDRLGEARALNRLGVAAYYQNDYARALPLYSESLRIAREEGADDDVANALNNLGVLYFMWGSLDRALDHYRQALDIRREQGDDDGLARGYNNLGGVADAAGRDAEAIEYFSNALTLYQEAGNESLAVSTMNNLGQSLFKLDRLEAALERFTTAHEIARRIGDEGAIAVAEDNIGRVLLAQGRAGEAERAFRRGLELKRGLDDRLGTATSQVNLATALAELGDVDASERNLYEALDLVREIGVPQIERDIHQNLAELQERTGDLRGAIASLRRSHEIHTRMISDNASRRLAEMSALLEVEKKNAEIVRLNHERTVQRNLVLGLVGASALLATVVVLLWSRNRIQVRAAQEIADRNLQLSRAHDELDRASRAEIAHLARVTSLGEMTAAVAHELNQPLAAILTNAQLAAGMISPDSPDGHELEATVDDIALGARRAWELLDNLRHLARRGEIEQRPLDMRNVLKQAVDIARAEAGLHQVSIDLTTPAEPLPVEGDPVLLQQVVLNLLQNAISAVAEPEAEDDERIVTVTAETRAGRVQVSVADGGPPIADDVLANLFRPFFTTRADGLGMGLAICKRLVEAHEGRIWAQRAGARGLVVGFELPPASAADTAPDRARADVGSAVR